MRARLGLLDIEIVEETECQTGGGRRGGDVVGDGMPAQDLGRDRRIVREPEAGLVVLFCEIGQDGAGIRQDQIVVLEDGELTKGIEAQEPIGLVLRPG